MQSLRQVMLLVETSKVYGRGLLDGIGRYAMAHGQWSLYVDERGLADEPPKFLRSWKGDGIIFRSTNENMVRAIRRTGVPAIDTNSNVIGHEFPLVYVDENHLAQLAVSHFLERGFQNFGFCTVEEVRWVDWRRAAFLSELASLGLQAHTASVRAFRSGGWNNQCRRLAEWVKKLPKPIAVLAANDVCATRLISACRTIGVHIPEHVAVLGIDNDEVLCRLTSPPLSSIDLGCSAMGYRAASLLDELMSGSSSPSQTILLPPLGVAARQSTDVHAIADEHLAKALSFIREHACQGIGVDDVLRHLSISRATLERKFAATLDTTPREAIQQIRIARIKRLLAETEHSIDRVAQLTGYRSQSHFCVAFKRETGLTPREYRASAASSAFPA